MASPEIQRRVSQLRHDMDDVYTLLDATNQTVATVASTQRRHSFRLEEIQQSLDLTVGRLDRMEQAQHRLEQSMEATADRLDRLEQTQQEQSVKLDAILDILRGERSPASSTG
jgi:chromosome segregation ATPase